MPVVTGIDILGIQKYVFASNKLKDVLAASWMVEHVTKREQGSLLQWGMTDQRVLLAAGGNAIVEFDSRDAAKTWTSHYTRWLQNEAFGLDVVVAHCEYSGRPLAWGLKALSIELARAKLERRPHAPQLGLSVTAACSVTGLPATSVDLHEGLLISRHMEVLRQDTVQYRAKEHWDSYLPELEKAPGWKSAFPLELDLMGRTHGDTSLLGIVHVDGNGVGGAIQGWLNRCSEENVSDERVRTEYHQWSIALEELGESVLKATVRRLTSRVLGGDPELGTPCVVRGTPHELGFSLRDWRDDKAHKTPQNATFLPFRPILLGGDDLTFVCDGRIAIDLAAAALDAFSTRPIPHLGQTGDELNLTACAGVALVRSHAPFDRGYELAASLCASAKGARRIANGTNNVDTGCWLDWHISSTRPTDSVEDLRKREYQGEKLTMRPYPLVGYDERKGSWTWLDSKVLGPEHDDEDDDSFRGLNAWSGSRNRLKEIGMLVLEGSDSVKRRVDAWRAIDVTIQLPADLADGGFIDGRTPLRDAVEILDLHLRLEPDPSVGNDASVALGVHERCQQ